MTAEVLYAVVDGITVPYTFAVDEIGKRNLRSLRDRWEGQGVARGVIVPASPEDATITVGQERYVVAQMMIAAALRRAEGR